MKEKESKYIKVGAVSPHIRLGDIGANVKKCISEAARAANMGIRVLVFPELTLTGATLGDLFRLPDLLDRAERGLGEFIDATAELDMMSFIGLPVEIDSACYNCTAVVYMGELLALVPKHEFVNGDDRYFDTPHADIDDINFAARTTDLISEPVFSAPFDSKIKIEIESSYGVDANSNIVVCPVAIETAIGTKDSCIAYIKRASLIDDRIYVLADAGVGESTTDAVYSAHNIIAERGEILAEAEPFAADNLISANVRISKPKPCENSVEAFEDLFSDEEDDVLPRKPFLPIGKEKQKTACLEALEIQAQGLAARVERSYSKSMVIGVSGGLDSTLALLVCARAADILGMDRKNIIGVTMPCFGTTKRTRSNAEKLCDALGATLRTVDIRASVVQHLSDIGHDGVTTDVTYENAQARERTQVLMDIANMNSGLVVGTGDLSELVLGWATYNGDHMSMYAVNASIPKTMVRHIVEVYSEKERENGEVSAILNDILATPVSPELLPPKDGEIAQCTEALVGPYELHDFFIYCILECGFSLRETYARAKESLGDVYDNSTIFGWLRVFVRRFISQQFKRSCLPDGPRVSSISVSPRGALNMPSDVSSAVWLEELDEMEKEENE